METYFSKFPLISYSNSVAIDITKRVKLLDRVSGNPFAFFPYDISNGERADNFHRTRSNPDGSSIIGAMRNAIADAGLQPGDIGYVNAHGTSTPLGDKNETEAIKAALGDHAKKIVVNSTKSMTGHLLGGAGGLESVFTILALHHQKSPPTINIFNQDPECDLDYCANTARDVKIDHAIKNNFGFGGTNGTLIFGKLT